MESNIIQGNCCSKCREVSSRTNQGAQFSSQLQGAIRSARAGTSFEFSEIKASSIAGAKNLETIVVRIR